METLETVRLSKRQELARYRQRPDAKSYIVRKLEEQIKALENCVDLNDSAIDNQLLILLRNTIWKALNVENQDDALIIGMRLTSNPEIKRIGLADLIYTTKLDDPQKGLYELLEIRKCDRRGIAAHDKTQSPSAQYAFDLILEGLDNFKM
ncbi:hypothetical protein [uncultured Alistipes sp.]|jgi:hypothetical protein|uniref:hypothetical protein n=1 Tax=uncultured Alistipes sp. TaxID=538949 RepID=UPI00263044BE|nr:hypothetical protein [uncultured Alistipes sp.]